MKAHKCCPDPTVSPAPKTGAGLAYSGDSRCAIRRAISPFLMWLLIGLAICVPDMHAQDRGERVEFVEGIDTWQVEVHAGAVNPGGFLQGPALEAGIGLVGSEDHRGGMCFLPSGDCFLASEGVILIVTPDRSVRNFTGTAGLPGYQDGPAAEALFGRQLSLASDGQGGLLVGDRSNRCLRRLSKRTGTWLVETLAGNPLKAPWIGRPVDGVGPKAVFRNLHAPVVTDAKGTAYVMDDNFLRRITLEGRVETLNPKGGSGKQEIEHNSGVPGSSLPDLRETEPLDSARFSLIMNGGLAVGGDGRVYVADRWNRCIRGVDIQAGRVSVAVGPGTGYRDGPEKNCGFHDSPGYILYDPYRKRFYTNGVDDWGLRVWENGAVKTLAGGGKNNKGFEGPAKGASINWASVRSVDPRPPHDLYFGSSGGPWSGRIGRLFTTVPGQKRTEGR